MKMNATTSTADPGKSQRRLAAQRSWFCPGAGFAQMGRGRLAVLAYLLCLAGLGAFAWLAAVLQIVAIVWALLALAMLACVTLIAEQVVARLASPRPPSPVLLVKGFLPTALVVYAVAAAAVVPLLFRFGTLRLAGSGMAPTIERGSLLLYEKRTDTDRLRKDTIILYGLSQNSAWGRPGSLTVSRILAVPGDRLSLRGKQYVVNGSVESAASVLGEFKPVIQVPSEPDHLVVPEGCYFVVQDSPANSYDSRVLSWVEASSLVSTHLYSLNGLSLVQ